MSKTNKAALVKELRRAIEMIDGTEDPHVKLGYVGSLVTGVIAELEGKDSWQALLARKELRKRGPEATEVCHG